MKLSICLMLLQLVFILNALFHTALTATIDKKLCKVYLLFVNILYAMHVQLKSLL